MKLQINPLASILSAALLAAMTFAGNAIIPAHSYAATATPVDNDTIDRNILNKQVERKLELLPWYGVFDNLQYTVDGDEVVLSGQVVQPVTKTDAQNAVASIKGVHVVNNIEVLPNSSFDNQTRRAEYRALFSNANLGRYSQGAVPQIHIIVKNGHVNLVGHVMNQMDRQIAGMVANQVPGVFSVENDLQIGR